VRRLALLLLLLPAAAPAAETPRRLSLDDVLKLALSGLPRLAGVKARAEGAHATALSAGGRLFPSVHLSEEWQHYDSPFDVAFEIPGGMKFPPLRARDQDTNSFVAAVDQPLTGLLRRAEEYVAGKRGADAAEAAVRVAEAAIREAVTVEYLKLFEASALEKIALASAEELGEQVAVTEAKLKAGSATNADLLRVKVAVGNARQQAIVAHTQGRAARASLLSAAGQRPDDASIELSEPTALLDGAPQAGDLSSAIDLGLQRRPELAQARLSAEAAMHTARARTFALLPEVDFEGAYLRLDGQVFAPKDSAFIGIRASWAVWEWGATWNAGRAARAAARAATADAEEQARTIQVEVVTRRAQLDAAKSAVELARATIVSAEEAYRVTEALVRAGAATTTDLLDSQAALTQARLNLTRARYEEAIARVNLERAEGGQSW
jgi:outer membrane protein